MTTAVEQARTDPGFGELERMAMEQLRADGLLILERGAPEPQVVAREGLGAELEAHLADLPVLYSSDELVHGRCSGLHVISAPLLTDEGPALGTLHAVFRKRPAYGDEDLDRLVRIFARHTALALTYNDLRLERDRGARWGKRLDDLEDLAFTTQLEDMTERVTEAMHPLTGATAVCITVWDQERDILRALPGAFGATDRTLPASITGPASNPQSLAARVFKTGRPYMTNHPGADPGMHQAYIEAFHIDRVLAVPLRYGRGRIGVLILVNKPTPFTFADVHAAESASARIAMAVEMAQSLARVRIQQRLEGIVADAAMAVARGQSVEDCVGPAFRELCAVTESSLVGLVPHDGQPFLYRHAAVPPALEQRLFDDAHALVQRSVGAFPKGAGDPGWAALHAPVELYGERIAALAILRRTGEPFYGYEAAVVSRLANTVALAWATERYQHQRAEVARLREREHIADELHDRVAQILFAAQLGLDSLLESDATPEAGRQRIREVSALLVRGDAAIRDVIDRLAVAPHVSLTRRLRLEVESVEEAFGVAVHVELDDERALDRAPPIVGDCMVRVAREATVNAAKHAGPCRISLKAGPDGRGGLVLSVIDDGLGRPTAGVRREGHGMRQLRRAVKEVGGTLRVSRRNGSFGTRLVAVFPACG